MVALGSAIRSIAEVDREGVRVRLAVKSAFEPYLENNLQHARLLTGQGNPTAFDLLRTGRVEVLAGFRHQLIEVQLKLPGSRIVDRWFLVVEQTLAIPKGREAELRYNQFGVCPPARC